MEIRRLLRRRRSRPDSNVLEVAGHTPVVPAGCIERSALSPDGRSVPPASQQMARPLPPLRLRPPRHPRPLPRMRHGRRNTRMTRRLLNLLTALSLLIAAAVVPAIALWAWT